MKYLLVLQSLFLVGCTTKTVIEKVEVPVYSCPVIEVPVKPNLAIYSINRKQSNQQVLKAYGKTVDQLLGYSDTLIQVIDNQNRLQNEKIYQNDN